jgi:hypothetical protein
MESTRKLWLIGAKYEFFVISNACKTENDLDKEDKIDTFAFINVILWIWRSVK